MGVCINYRLATERKYVKSALDRTESLARTFKENVKSLDVDVIIERESDIALRIDMDGCETLALCFQTYAELIADHPWKAEDKELWEIRDAKPEYHDYLLSTSFVKTQYAKSLAEHGMVAELIRVCASYCEKVDVYDEGDYYYTGDLADAARAISGNAAVIASLGGMLKNAGWKEDEIIKGGETLIKSTKKPKV